ncbi:response regulator, partial [Geomonas sp.]|uniref:response regulator n=1 Tax=Geomonas sp. TaxID=2651584 RepID=UPI002B4AA2F1
MEPTKLLGEILVERGLLTPVAVERVVALASRLGKRLGVVLEEMGLLTEEELALALARQYHLRPVANFATASFAPEVLATVGAEVALENLLFPLRLEGNRLTLAMADPSDTRIVNNLAANSGLRVLRCVATGKEIKAAICRHYLGKECQESGGKTVLVVEDDRSVREQLEEVLSPHYRVLTAVDGLDAYKEVIAKKPQVVLTDKEMPKLSGFALLSALRSTAETKRIPAILITGVDGEQAETEAFRKGFFDFIHKPINEVTLLNRVNRAYEFSQNQNYLFLK